MCMVQIKCGIMGMNQRGYVMELQLYIYVRVCLCIKCFTNESDVFMGVVFMGVAARGCFRLIGAQCGP